MTLPEKFIQHLKSFPFIQKTELQLLAVSGGLDSILLCHLMMHSGYDFVIAHCNFQLRGDESERDENFVIELAEKYGKRIVVKKFDTQKYAAEKKVSIQVAARELRYDWFWEMVEEKSKGESQNLKVEEEYKDVSSKYQDKNQQLTEQQTAPNPKPQTSAGNNDKQKVNFILTAHHADDNIETVVMNFFRGTGLHGLTGMDNELKKIVRPLLPFKKEEFLAYANEHQLAFVEDSSNANNHYTRNFFRNELLPSVKTIFPKAEENILKNIERLSDVAKLYDEAVSHCKKQLVEVKGNEKHIPILKLQKQVALKTILWEIIKEKEFAAAQTDEVIKLMTATNGSYIESAKHRIIKNRRWLIIAPLQQQQNNQHIVIDEKDTKITFAEGELLFQNKISVDNFSIPAGNEIAAIDADSITFPLLLRKWKQGDYFYPLGMQKKKKISRFLIDRKLSVIEKEHLWVIESDKKIVWVVNHRIDDRFKIKSATKFVLVMKLVVK